MNISLINVMEQGSVELENLSQGGALVRERSLAARDRGSVGTRGIAQLDGVADTTWTTTCVTPTVTAAARFQAGGEATTVVAGSSHGTPMGAPVGYVAPRPITHLSSIHPASDHALVAQR